MQSVHSAIRHSKTQTQFSRSWLIVAAELRAKLKMLLMATRETLGQSQSKFPIVAVTSKR